MAFLKNLILKVQSMNIFMVILSPDEIFSFQIVYA
ncbi:hypothetical protein VQ7734_04750 [Vibrio quintilis]|uniref:Uncharacterized protein n=1 Tax=Vibrio quintilis TaxID=1117707 RepID=A0A1M7Z2F1_9VIBR|nr:hypothetical protein VQ7734_04750 [Vibrio quintilis]